MKFLIIFLVIALIIVSVFVKVSYENKVKEVKSILENKISKFLKLKKLRYEVRTDRKKINSWDKQHKIDYIIINNKDLIIEDLKLYNEYVLWWNENIAQVIGYIDYKTNFFANSMFIFGNMFRSRIKTEKKQLINEYKPTEVLFTLRTFTLHSSTRHYNPNTGEWWYDKSPDESTFTQILSPKEVLFRVEILAKYNFEMTEYQYSCENQRRLMTHELREQIIERDKSICQICHKHCNRDEIEIDHIRPVSKGGKTNPSNLQVLCVACNRSKSNKWLNVISDIKLPKGINKTNKTFTEKWDEFDTDYNKDKFNRISTNGKGVQIGDVIQIKFENYNEEMTFTLVDNLNNLDDDKVSVFTPLGEAVYNQEEGDVIRYKTPGGIETIKILKIKKHIN